MCHIFDRYTQPEGVGRVRCFAATVISKLFKDCAIELRRSSTSTSVLPALDRWLQGMHKRKPLLPARLWLFPIICAARHWRLGVVDFESKLILYIDSLGGRSSCQVCRAHDCSLLLDDSLRAHDCSLVVTCRN